MKKRGEHYRQTSREIIELSNNMCQELDATSQEMYRIADICENADQIVNDIDKEFSVMTKLDGFDLSFLFLATAMQCIRQYVLTPFTKRVDDQKAAKMVKGTIKEKSDRSHQWYNPSLNEIITNPVPFDAIQQSERLKEKVLRETGHKILSGARNHRFVTLGHDPILGLVVGTANIATSTLTTWDLTSYHVKTGLNKKGLEVDRIENQAQTDKVFSYTWNKLLHEGLPGREKVSASLVKEVVHLKSDVNSTLSLPLPVVTRFDPSLASKLASFGLDTGNAIDVLKQAGEAQVINLLIAMLHGMCFYLRTGKREDQLHLYKAKTRKILLYSNLIASSSNVIAVAVAQYLGQENAMRYLDVGGLAVTLYRLISDIRFIRQVKREFLENRWYEIIMDLE